MIHSGGGTLCTAWLQAGRCPEIQNCHALTPAQALPDIIQQFQHPQHIYRCKLSSGPHQRLILRSVTDTSHNGPYSTSCHV